MTKSRSLKQVAVSNFKNKKILLLGAGFMGREYCKTLHHLGFSEVTVICNSLKSANLIRADFGFIAFDGGYQKNHSHISKKFDLTILSLPIPMLLKGLETLILLGHKKILVEKPVALSSKKLSTFIKKHLSSKKSLVKTAFNRMAYPAFLELKRRVAQDKGITSCSYTFTEWPHAIDFSKNNQDVYYKWGLSNSLHVISLAHALIGLPKKWSCYRSRSLKWHPSGAVFTGSGVTKKNIPFSYHADWLSAGRWSLTVMTRKHAYRLMPLEELYICKKKNTVWEPVNYTKETSGIKEGISEEIISMLEPNSLKEIKLPDLKRTLAYVKVAEKIFGYEKDKKAKCQ